MWNVVDNNHDLEQFLESIYYFHDSCIKEMRYISGAYVTEELSMFPVNVCRTLSIIIQRQFADIPMIELEFEGLKYLRLSPAEDPYTCEILDATMILKQDCIYWCDCGGLSETDMNSYDGTVICASKFRWRAISSCMGQERFYKVTM